MSHFLRRWLGVTCLAVGRPRRYGEIRRQRRLQWLGREELDAIQERKLRRLLSHVATTVPFYQQLNLHQPREGASLGDILESWPLIDKELMRSHPGDFLSSRVSKRRVGKSATGGSTGTWFEFSTDLRLDYRRRAGDLVGREWAGWRIGEPYGLLWGHVGDLRRAKRGGGIGGAATSCVGEAVLLNAYDMTENDITVFLERVRSQRATILLGYASALHLAARLLEYAGGMEESSLRGIISAAELLTPEMRTTIEKAFRVPVFNRYGSREFALVAQECEKHKGMHVMQWHVVVEIVKGDGSPTRPGEVGEIVITDLDNYVMPFVRYRTGDLGLWMPEDCECGRDLPLIGNLAGRTSDILVGANGQLYSCQSPRPFVQGIAGLRQLQIIQENLEHVRLVVVIGEGWSDENEKILTRRVRNMLGRETKVSMQYVEKIDPTPSGKYRFIVSDVGAAVYRGAKQDLQLLHEIHDAGTGNEET